MYVPVIHSCEGITFNPFRGLYILLHYWIHSCVCDSRAPSMDPFFDMGGSKNRPLNLSGSHFSSDAHAYIDKHTHERTHSHPKNASHDLPSERSVNRKIQFSDWFFRSLEPAFQLHSSLFKWRISIISCQHITILLRITRSISRS